MRNTTIRGLTATGGLLLATLVTAAPATARDDPGPPAGAATQTLLTCELERVGTQLVRCDDLTGNGATAPTYIPERR